MRRGKDTLRFKKDLPSSLEKLLGTIDNALAK